MCRVLHVRELERKFFRAVKPTQTTNYGEVTLPAGERPVSNVCIQQQRSSCNHKRNKFSIFPGGGSWGCRVGCHGAEREALRGGAPGGKRSPLQDDRARSDHHPSITSLARACRSHSRSPLEPCSGAGASRSPAGGPALPSWGHGSCCRRGC